MVVLVFISIISLLVVMSVESAALESRMSVNVYRSSQDSLIAWAGLRKGEAQLKLGLVPCEIPVMSTNELMSKSPKWWHSSVTCHGQLSNRKYQYVFERLGENACAILFKNQGVVYYRISSRAEPRAKYANSRILQTTNTVPSKLTTICLEKTKKLNNLRQSWRILR